MESDQSNRWWNRKISRRTVLRGMAGATAAGVVGYHLLPDILWKLAGPLPDGALMPVPVSKPFTPGYLHTGGRWIKDSSGNTVTLVGGNWGGGETEGLIPGMLHKFTVDEYAQQIKAEGFSTVRLPFCVSTVLQKDPRLMYPDPSQIAGNPQLQGATVLEVFDGVVAACKRAGLRVILDCHRITPGFGEETNGVPFSDAYPPERWQEALQLMAGRYAGDDTVVGIELFNEPGKLNVLAPWQSGANWGEGGNRDWWLLATLGGLAVQEVNPDLLILVQGVWSDSAGPKMYGVGPALPIGPGANLIGVGQGNGVRKGPMPVKLKYPNKVVYTFHLYDWGVNPWQIPYLTGESRDASFEIWKRAIAFIAEQNIAPLMCTELGTNNGLQPGSHPARAYVESDTPNPSGKSFSYELDFLRQYMIGFTLWQFNAVKSPHFDPEWFAYLRADGKGPASIPYANAIRQLMQDLQLHNGLYVAGPGLP